MKGIFELPFSLSIRCYCAESIRGLLAEVREGFKAAGVPDNKKYASQEVFFGNVTFCRFASPPTDTRWKKLVDELKDVDFGQLNVKEVHLVTTNGVCHPSKTKLVTKVSFKDK